MSQKARRNLMDWNGLEARLRELIVDVCENAPSQESKVWRDTVYAIDAALAAYTGRGNATPLPQSPHLQQLQQDEWDRLGV